MSPAVVGALIFLSVALNFVQAWFILHLLAEKNELLDKLIEINKTTVKYAPKPAPKKAESKPKERQPLYMR